MQFSHRLSVELAAPVHEVWRVIADYAQDAAWREGVSMRVQPEGLVRDGTRTFESLRMFGSLHHTEAVIDRVVEGRSFRFVSRDGRVEGTRSIEAHGLGTRLTVSIAVRPPFPLALFAPWIGRSFRKRVERDLARLRELLAVPDAVRTLATTAPIASAVAE